MGTLFISISFGDACINSSQHATSTSLESPCALVLKSWEPFWRFFNLGNLSNLEVPWCLWFHRCKGLQFDWVLSIHYNCCSLSWVGSTDTLPRASTFPSSLFKAWRSTNHWWDSLNRWKSVWKMCADRGSNHSISEVLSCVYHLKITTIFAWLISSQGSLLLLLESLD